MAAPTLDGKSLGNVQSVRIVKSANLFHLPMPGSSDTEAEVFDMLGNISSITVHCIMTAADVATLKTSVDSITALCSNEQSTTVDFVSDITGTAKVMVNNVDVTVEVNGLQCVADLNIQLLVGVRN